MNKAEALENIEKIWQDSKIPLKEKITNISSEFYSVGLDVAATAAFIHATESELTALLSLSELDDAIIEKLSVVNPPKTTWTILASASEDEIEYAINAIEEIKQRNGNATDEFVFNSMIEIAGLTKEQKVANLTGDVLNAVLKKGMDFRLLSEKESKFIKDVAGQKKKGKGLSEKQINWLMDILTKLIMGGAIKRDSIDGDQVVCKEVLDAMEL